MVDSISAKLRSEIMSRIRSANTEPEMHVRKLLHAMGYRFSLHCNYLPGRPDIVLRRWNALIYINGCFWHGHDCQGTRQPKSNRGYWKAKIQANMARDARNQAECRSLGWRVLVVWECVLRGKKRFTNEHLAAEMAAWIERDAKRASIKNLRGRR